MAVSQLYVGNDMDIMVQPFTDASTGDAIDDADLRVTVCEANNSRLITGATNATPIVITSAAHGLATGDYVAIAGVGGNTAARGTFQVTVTGTNTFSLDDSVGNGTYTRGGRWYKALSDSLARAIELTWDGTRYLGVLSGDLGLVEGSRYALVFYENGSYRDQYSQVDVTSAGIRSGSNN